MYNYPRISIEFCTKCKWNLRAAWYLQELLSTFGTDLGEVALQPGTDGIFIVTLIAKEGDEPTVIWDRKEQGGFPDSKDLKRLVRNVIDPDRDLGHVDRSVEKQQAQKAPASGDHDNSTCPDC